MKLSEIEKLLNSLPPRLTDFIEPMECLAVTKIPDDVGYVYEIKMTALFYF